MRKAWLLVLASIFVVVGATAVLAAEHKNDGHFHAKVGDKIFVCGCGESCPCQMLSMKEGKCGCGQDMVQAEVIKVEEGVLHAMVNGKEQKFSTVGKYMCACGDACPCKAISQSPAKCPCGVDMKPVGS